jgi:hypothetical protein
MSLAYHCDRAGCDTWMRVNTGLPNPFTAVVDLNHGGILAHACSLDCLMHWAAEHSTPTTETAT